MADSLDLPVAATQTSTDIIETLADLDGAGVTAIAETLERSKSSVHDHLQTLTALGFVVKRGYEYRVGPRFLRLENNCWFLDLAGLLWEQLVLSLPFKYICSDDCRGVCPKCGRNLNLGPCECEVEEGDPRLALFRRLKIE